MFHVVREHGPFACDADPVFVGEDAGENDALCRRQNLRVPQNQTQQFPFSGSGGEIGQRRFLADIGNCRVDGQQGRKAYPQAVLSVL